MAPDKYPRTWHLAVSPGIHRDDRQHRDDHHLVGRELVLLEKLDGSGVSLHRDGVFARSKSGPPNHPSYAPLKALHATVRPQIPPDVSVFGEWLHTLHTIRYPLLPRDAELQLFAVRYDDDERWASWDEVVAWAQRLAVATVPVLERAVYDDVGQLHAAVQRHAAAPSRFGPDREGVVVRLRGRLRGNGLPPCGRQVGPGEPCRR